MTYRMQGAPEDRSITAPNIDARRGKNARRAAAYGAALAAGLGLRLWMLKEFFQANGDTLTYGELAKNLLLHGRYALPGNANTLQPSLMRLPGYPLFLAVCFRLFGVENYVAVTWVQIVLELVGCLLLADFARRMAPERMKSAAAMATIWLAALCPFTAGYTVNPLTETPTLFLIALALWALARFRERPGWPNALIFTFAVSYAALLRPDGALVAVALAPAMVLGLPQGAIQGKRLLRMGLVCTGLALAPFAAWAWRNWQVFHLFQPLAPRYANDPGEPALRGWERWFGTWSLDFVSTYQVYWVVPGGPFDISELPGRAFDSPAERARTAELANEYEADGEEISPALDAEFAVLARQRIRAHPVRYYVWLPLGRLADMLLRPRVENLPIDLDWWVYAHHHFETRVSWALAGLNVLYFGLGIAGLCLPLRRRRTVVRGPGLRPLFWRASLAYFVLRCALLLTVAAPEARYTLEFFPFLFAYGGVALAAAGEWILGRVQPGSSAPVPPGSPAY